MASDPYHNFAADVRSSLSSAQQLAQQYTALAAKQSGADSSSSHRHAVQDVWQQLQDAIEGLQSDMGDVQESIRMVETRGVHTFGLSVQELNERKAFLRACQDQVQVSAIQGAMLGLPKLRIMDLTHFSCRTSPSWRHRSATVLHVPHSPLSRTKKTMRL